MQLAFDRHVRLRWTDAIHAEWIDSLSRNRPDIEAEKLQEIRDKVNEAVPDCLVENYEDLIDVMKLPDENDCHVLAAAIKGECNHIVTWNITDFPDSVLGGYGIKAITPDDFLMDLHNAKGDAFGVSVSTVRQRLRKPTKSTPAYLNVLKKQRLNKLAMALAMRVSDI